MKKMIAAFFAGAALAGLASPALSQTTPSFNSEISLFGSWEDRREPEDREATVFNLRYGRFFRPQLVGTLGLQRERTETSTSDTAITALTIGAKYYISPIRAQAIVPFLDGAVGVAHIDTGPSDSTDFTWEIGGGVSWFFTQATSFDAGLRFFHINTDSETSGTRLFVGITTRF